MLKVYQITYFVQGSIHSVQFTAPNVFDAETQFMLMTQRENITVDRYEFTELA